MKDCLPRGLACEQRLRGRRQSATVDPKDVRPGNPEGDGARRNPRRVRGRATASVGRGDAADRAFVQFVSVLVRVAVSKARLAEDHVAGIGGTP